MKLVGLRTLQLVVMALLGWAAGAGWIAEWATWVLGT